MRKYFYWFGIVGSIIFILTVIIAGFLIPNFDHLQSSVSHISILIDKQYLVFILPLFYLYNICFIIYGFYIFIWQYKLSIINKVQAFSLILNGLCGLVVYYFPMSPFGSPPSFSGAIHIAFVCLVAGFSFFLPFSSFLTFRGKNNKLSIYSLLTSLILLVVGSITCINYTFGIYYYFGFMERIAIFSFLLWIIVVSIIYMKEVKRDEIRVEETR